MPSLLLRLPDDLHALAKVAADADGRSLNNWIARQVQAGVLRAAHQGNPELRAALDAEAAAQVARSRAKSPRPPRRARSPQ